jgi:outer membrane receptor protein involved in Fe transport
MWRSGSPLLGLAVAAVFPAISPGAQAQTVALEEIVVTARRRVETLQETPVAVSAFSSEDLRQAQIEDVGDLTRMVPGLSRREGRKEGDLSIRGIGTSTAGANIDPGVGVYVDEVFIPRSDSQLVDVINAESVQVLRGPQGTLFGKNTAGGALLLTTQKPGEEMVGGVRLNLGKNGRQLYRFNISGPVVGGLSAGITLDYQREDGYMEDVATAREYGDRDRQSALLQLHYEGEAGFYGDLMVFRGRVRENAPPSTCVQGQSPGVLQSCTAPGERAAYAELCAQSEALAEDDKVQLDRQALPWEMDNTLAGLTLAWELGDMQIKSITGYLQQDNILQSSDTDSSALFTINNRVEANRQLAGSGFTADNEERSFVSQEFQLVGDAFDNYLSYTVGVFASREDIDATPSGVVIAPGGYLGQPLPAGQVATVAPGVAGFRGLQSSDYTNESWAVFGQAIINFNDVWQLTLGGRYTQENKEAKQTNYATTSGGLGVLSRAEFDALETGLVDVVINPDNPQVRGDDEWQVFSPAVTLTAFIPEQWSGPLLSSGMVYFSASEGFKAGGFTPLGNRFLPFDPEEIFSYELGAKQYFLEQRLRVNGAVYYTDYDDIQLRVTRTLDAFTTVTGIINAATAQIRGAEVEVKFQPAANWLLGLTASYTDPQFDQFEDEDRLGNPIDRSDDPFAYIPDTTLSASLQHTWPWAAGPVVTRLDTFYRDEIYVGLDAGAAEDPVAYLDDFWLWNARLNWSPAAINGMDVALYINNALDEDYVATGNFSRGGIGAASLIYGQGRTYGVELSYRW